MEFASLASTAVQAVGAIMGGESAGTELNGQADQYAAAARNARMQGGAREEMVRRNNAKRLAEQRAAYAQSGFDPNSGSVGIQAESAGNAELDALTTRYESELQAIGYGNQAASLRASAKSARRQGYLNAFGTLMQAGGSYFGKPRVGPLAPVESRIPVPLPGRG